MVSSRKVKDCEKDEMLFIVQIIFKDIGFDKKKDKKAEKAFYL